jgi:hypothetical protein
MRRISSVTTLTTPASAEAQKNVGTPAYWVYKVMPITVIKKRDIPGMVDDAFEGETCGQGLAIRRVIDV